MHDVHDPYAALRHAGYRRLLSGNILARIGFEMQSVAVGWELWERTHSPTNLGLVGLVQFLPVILLSLPAGHIVDRYSRKALLLTAQGLMAAASLALAGLSYLQGPVELIYVCLLIVGISQAFGFPARWALVPMLVPHSDLANAMTWNSSGLQISTMVGPASGGLAWWASGGAVVPYLLAASCSLACVALLSGIRPQGESRATEGTSLATLLAGVRFVWTTRLILATITLDLFAVLLGGATALLPIFASEEFLNVGPSGLGWLRTAPAIGAFVMALVIAHRPPLRHAGPAMLWSVSGFGVATIVFGLSQNFWLSFAMLALTGALDNVSVVVRSTLVQVLTPDHMRGRVSAVNFIFISSSNQLGAFESGITAAWFGPVPSVVAGGVGTVLVVLAVILKWPEVLRLGSLHRTEEMDIRADELVAEEEAERLP
jgi:MFS family permease